MRRNILLLGLALGMIALGVFLNTALTTDAEPVLQGEVNEDLAFKVEEDQAPTPLIRESMPVGDAILIEVVDRSTQQALADADVFAIDMNDFGFMSEQDFLNGTMGHELIFLAYATAYHADSKGRLHIPIPKGKLLIRGLTPTHAGVKTWEKGHVGALLLELDRASMIPVQVFDAIGDPAEGVNLGLYFHRGEEFIGMTGRSSKSDGSAFLRVPAEIMDDLADIVATVTPFLLSDDAPHVEVDLNQIPKNPIELRLPETGSVEVILLEETGGVASANFLGSLVLMWPTADGEGWIETGSTLPLHFRNGKATLGHVGLGLQLQARAWSFKTGKRGELERSGPRSLGARVEMAVMVAELKQTDHFLLGRVLNAEGMVAKKLELELRIRDSERPSMFPQSHKIRTDADGRFRYKFQTSDYFAGQLEVSLIMRRTKRKPRRMATVQISQPFDSEEMDLGDFVVRELPVRVSGIVVDTAGKPIENASVEVSHRTLPSQRWQELKELTVYSQDDGSFIVRGERGSGEFRLLVDKPGFADTQETVSVGEGSVVLELEAGTQVTGRVFIDEKYLRDDVLVRLQCENGNSGLILLRAGEDSYVFEKVSSGLVELEFMTPTGFTFYRWPQIRVESSSKSISLPDLNLRGRISSIHVDLQDALGQSIPEGWVRNEFTGSLEGFRGRPLEVIGLDHHYRLVVGARGKRTLDLGEVFKDQVVSMRDALPIRLVLDGAPDVGPRWQLSSQMSLASETDWMGEILAWSSQGSLTTSAPWLGLVRVEFFLSRAARFSYPFADEVMIANSISHIEIQDLEEEQTFHLSIDQNFIEQTKALILEREQAMEGVWH